MIGAWSKLKALVVRVPLWVSRILFTAVYGYFALTWWREPSYGWFGFAMFCLGQSWAQLFADLQAKRHERIRAMWEDLARKAMSRNDEYHAVFVEMGPHVQVMEEFAAKLRRQQEKAS